MKTRHLFKLTAGLAMLSLVFAACTCGPTAKQTAVPTGAAAATAAPKAAATAAPTSAPAPVTISIWHGYTGVEEQLFSQAVSDFMAANPDVTIDLLAVPFDELQNKFQTEVAAGGGPAMTTGPQDRMAVYQAADLLAEIDESASFLSQLVPASVNGGKIGGKLYGVPLNNKVLALFYNKSMIETPPTDFDQLLSMAADHGLAITADWFHNYMWVSAFGAQLFDENYKCVLDTTGAAPAFAYLKTVCDSPGVTCDGNDGDMDALFRTGQVAFRIQGNWLSGDAENDLGAANVGVARIPTIPGHGDPRPWNQSEMASISVNATPDQVAAAMRFIEYFTSADVQKTFLEQANWIPANASVDTSGNPIVGGFLEQVPYSDPFPVVAELGATWSPMQDAVTKILDGVLTPEDAITQATQLINQTNNK
jgi:arabinogalactan oligomer/maltooligosaccharide transport system substrate-binding protein